MITEEAARASTGMRFIVTGDSADVSHQFDPGAVVTIAGTHISSPGRAYASIKVASVEDPSERWWVGLVDLDQADASVACNCGCGVK